MYAKTAVQHRPEQTQLLELLLKNKANINARCTVRGWTVLDYVLRNEADNLATWLREKGAKRSDELK